MTLLTTETFLILAGLYLAALAVNVARDAGHPRRAGSTLFWGLLAVVFVGGKALPPFATGCIVLLLAGLAGAHQVAPPRRQARPAEERRADAERLGDRLLWRGVLIPALVIAFGFTLDRVRGDGWRLADAKQLTQVGLGLACVVGLAAAMRLTRATPRTAWHEGSYLLQALGWAIVLPQLLASLGGVFAKAGVGDVIAQLVGGALPAPSPLAAVVAYAAGMALFTIVMGNAFAAFPVITLGIGLPYVVQANDGNPAIMGALGMLAGYCGTLVTPMAANFNLVPTLLLDLADKHAVIKAQVPMAAAIWVFNVALMYLCVYRF